MPACRSATVRSMLTIPWTSQRDALAVRLGPGGRP